VGLRALEFIRDAAGRPIAIRIRLPEGGWRDWFHWAGDAIRGRLQARRAVPAAAAASGASSRERWVIEPRNEALDARLREVWKYRRLLGFFSAKSLSKLYQRTVLGAVWIFAKPLVPLIVNTVVFGGVIGVGSNGIPYFLFVNAGSALWDLFDQSVSWGTRSLELNRGFVTRIYVPRMILLPSTMAPAFVSFVISIGILLFASGYYKFTTGVMYLTPWNIGWALLSLVITVFLALGISLWTSVPGAQARDVRFTMTYVMGFWLFLTPVLYPLNVSAKYRWLLALNPMAATINGFKYGLLGIGTITPREWIASVIETTLILASGLWFFGRAEADATDKM
jgi:lipopolysaccharide transport system permease protein